VGEVPPEVKSAAEQLLGEALRQQRYQVERDATP
jgi:hypothetical protein